LTSSKVPVKRFMRTDVVTISSDVPIKEAVKTMYEKNVGSLVIVDGNEIKGIVTERDIARSLLIYNISNDAKIRHLQYPAGVGRS
jgi:CBS domain-containing protein